LDPDFWNARYGGEEFAYGTAPNAYLAARVDELPAGGSVLLLGEGEGRNGVWLAEHGFAVTVVDQSRAGLHKAQRLAAERGVALETVEADLTAWEWPEAAYDAAVAIFLHLPPEHRGDTHRRMIRAVKPGGRILVEGFRKEQLDYASGGPPVAEMLFRRGDLEVDFAGAEIQELEEEVRELDEGPYHQGPGALIHLIAERPAQA
jgi:cyclopropane fatty-acyl-phospholipid synthase-like methyltransferase